MAKPDDDNSTEPRRRGLGQGPIQRGTVALAAIRVIRITRQLAWHILEIVLALVILFEEWGWRPLSAILARLARIDLVARLEMWVRGLPSWPALAVFLVPSLLFLPLKLASFWLIANGHAIAATALFIFAKLVGTALYARIFQLTQPALLRLEWFARIYNWFMPWKDALIAHVRQTRMWQAAAVMKARTKQLILVSWQRLRPVAIAAVRRLRAVLGG